MGNYSSIESLKTVLYHGRIENNNKNYHGETKENVHLSLHIHGFPIHGFAHSWISQNLHKVGPTGMLVAPLETFHGLPADDLTISKERTMYTCIEEHKISSVALFFSYAYYKLYCNIRKLTNLQVHSHQNFTVESSIRSVHHFLSQLEVLNLFFIFFLTGKEAAQVQQQQQKKSAEKIAR